MARATAMSSPLCAVEASVQARSLCTPGKGHSAMRQHVVGSRQGSRARRSYTRGRWLGIVSPLLAGAACRCFTPSERRGICAEATLRCTLRATQKGHSLPGWQISSMRVMFTRQIAQSREIPSSFAEDASSDIVGTAAINRSINIAFSVKI